MRVRNSNSVSFHVYYCTWARREVSKSSDIGPQTCILRSLSMFFFTRHLQVEDAKRIPTYKGSGKAVQVFVYHITEHNLKSHSFRSQLLDHLENNAIVLLLRRSDLDFSEMFSFFVSGCTTELKEKLKDAHRRAVAVFDNRYQDAVLDLVKEIKRIQLNALGKNCLVPQTFPLLFTDKIASLSFGTSVKDISVESVTKASGLDSFAVKLCKKSEQRSKKRGTATESGSKTKFASNTDAFSAALAVRSIELRMRKTIYEASTHDASAYQLRKLPKKDCKKNESYKLQEKKNEPVLEQRSSREFGDEQDDVSDEIQNPSLSLFLPDGPRPAVDDEPDTSIDTHRESLLPRLTLSRQTDKPVPLTASSLDDNIEYDDFGDIFTDEEFKFHSSRTYAVYIPDQWGEKGEQLIYISFPDESDKIPFQLYDFPCSGYSTPCSYNLSEQCLSPDESPSISLPDIKKTIYPEPCPIYPLESCFPPVDLPVKLD